VQVMEAWRWEHVGLCRRERSSPRRAHHREAVLSQSRLSFACARPEATTLI
jgi:hypothetical protein